MIPSYDAGGSNVPTDFLDKRGRLPMAPFVSVIGKLGLVAVPYPGMSGTDSRIVH